MFNGLPATGAVADWMRGALYLNIDPQLWCSWGYFNRRMWVRRQLKLDDALEQADVLPDPQQPMVEDTSYGEERLRR